MGHGEGHVGRGEGREGGGHGEGREGREGGGQGEGREDDPYLSPERERNYKCLLVGFYILLILNWNTFYKAKCSY